MRTRTCGQAYFALVIFDGVGKEGEEDEEEDDEDENELWRWTDHDYGLFWFKSCKEYQQWAKAITTTVSVFEASQSDKVLGHITLSSVVKIGESLRLDMEFRAIELQTHARTYLFAVQDSSEFDMWCVVLRSIVARHD